MTHHRLHLSLTYVYKCVPQTTCLHLCPDLPYCVYHVTLHCVWHCTTHNTKHVRYHHPFSLLLKLSCINDIFPALSSSDSTGCINIDTMVKYRSCFSLLLEPSPSSGSGWSAWCWDNSRKMRKNCSFQLYWFGSVTQTQLNFIWLMFREAGTAAQEPLMTTDIYYYTEFCLCVCYRQQPCSVTPAPTAPAPWHTCQFAGTSPSGSWWLLLEPLEPCNAWSPPAHTHATQQSMYHTHYTKCGVELKLSVRVAYLSMCLSWWFPWLKEHSETKVTDYCCEVWPHHDVFTLEIPETHTEREIVSSASCSGSTMSPPCGSELWGGAHLWAMAGLGPSPLCRGMSSCR